MSLTFVTSSSNFTTIFSRACLWMWGVMSRDSSVRNSIFEIFKLSIIAWIAWKNFYKGKFFNITGLLDPGDAVSATTLKFDENSSSVLIIWQYAWLPVARWASSKIMQLTVEPSTKPLQQSFLRICGVRKKSLLVCQRDFLSCRLSFPFDLRV